MTDEAWMTMQFWHIRQQEIVKESQQGNSVQGSSGSRIPFRKSGMECVREDGKGEWFASIAGRYDFPDGDCAKCTLDSGGARKT
ncbi:hypothetical protein [Burkholderia metallica]|uniref:hypothetical protein n=1 Tax=Burkholderia metallica TaxID=488729 RepID=UPI00158A3FB1|nr:hypothetical protein [Burkholderia metallica]MCA8018870.1 hypothetical protein [Burkholderia metallica]